MSTYFISDLHLDPRRPEITTLALAFLTGAARQADALYILGDLFEAWIGDDAAGAPAAELAARSGMRLLPDPAVIDLYGQATVITHGDLLCSDDTAYLAFRAQTRNAQFIERFLAQSPAERIAFAERARQASAQTQAAMKHNDRDAFAAITDATESEVQATFARYGCTRMIHGHTHRPAIHQHWVDGRNCTRVVLGDWYEQGSVLSVDADGMALYQLQQA